MGMYSVISPTKYEIHV